MRSNEARKGATPKFHAAPRRAVQQKAQILQSTVCRDDDSKLKITMENTSSLTSPNECSNNDEEEVDRAQSIKALNYLLKAHNLPEGKFIV